MRITIRYYESKDDKKKQDEKKKVKHSQVAKINSKGIYFTTKGNIFKKSHKNKTFVGWSTKPGGKIKYDADKKYKYTSWKGSLDINLYPVYKKKKEKRRT